MTKLTDKTKQLMGIATAADPTTKAKRISPEAEAVWDDVRTTGETLNKTWGYLRTSLVDMPYPKLKKLIQAEMDKNGDAFDKVMDMLDAINAAFYETNNSGE